MFAEGPENVALSTGIGSNAIWLSEKVRTQPNATANPTPEAKTSRGPQTKPRALRGDTENQPCDQAEEGCCRAFTGPFNEYNEVHGFDSVARSGNTFAYLHMVH